jgi:hypothetical protein
MTDDKPTLKDVYDAELFQVYSYDGSTVKLANLSRNETVTATIELEVTEENVRSLPDWSGD